MNRFWSKVDKTGSCWEWTACKTHGYGQFRLDGKLRQAHRVAFYLTHSKWPDGVIDHLCRNKACVNPAHLDDTTQRENTTRGAVSKLNLGKSSKYTGVCLKRGRWEAQTWNHGYVFIGTFDTEDEAHEAYQKFILDEDPKVSYTSIKEIRGETE